MSTSHCCSIHTNMIPSPYQIIRFVLFCRSSIPTHGIGAVQRQTTRFIQLYNTGTERTPNANWKTGCNTTFGYGVVSARSRHPEVDWSHRRSLCETYLGWSATSGNRRESPFRHRFNCCPRSPYYLLDPPPHSGPANRFLWPMSWPPSSLLHLFLALFLIPDPPDCVCTAVFVFKVGLH